MPSLNTNVHHHEKEGYPYMYKLGLYMIVQGH